MGETLQQSVHRAALNEFEQLVAHGAYPPAPSPSTDGEIYAWLPTEHNPSKVILHRWNPETDTWESKSFAHCLPSKAWARVDG